VNFTLLFAIRTDILRELHDIKLPGESELSVVGIVPGTYARLTAPAAGWFSKAR
jgi:hypothetical protein